MEEQFAWIPFSAGQTFWHRFNFAMQKLYQI